MTLRNCLLGLVLSTILCFAAWLLILFSVDPDKSNWQWFLLLYLSLLFALTSLFTLMGFFVRSKIFSNKPIFSQVGISFRHGILFSIVAVGTLFLQGLRMLSWQNSLLLIIGVVILEFYFVNQESNS